MTEKVRKSDEEWKSELSAEAYQVTRQKGTERPFSGDYYRCATDGVYQCICCGAELFDAGDKYDSGSGWPSFTRPVGQAAVDEERDGSHGMIRTEVLCSRCDAHLGHVFPDGPNPTGMRYCINSAALKLKPKT